MKKRLIVNADDFGLSLGINKGIIEAHLKGILNSTSICANGEAFENAVKLAKENLTLDVGIHLILVGEKPLAAPEKIKSLVDVNGNFHKDIAEFTKLYFSGRINLNEVKYEFSLQFAKIINSGIKISHIDSHQHVHSLLKINKIVQEFAEQYNISFIRTTREKIQPYMFRSPKFIPRLIQLFILNIISSFSIRNSNFSKIKYFAGFYWGGNISKENLTMILLNLPPGDIVEIMCHPGCKDQNKKYDHWGYNHENELKAITNSEIKELLIDQNISLCSFKDTLSN